MGAGAKILADSISPDGVRLTTFEVIVARIVLAEFNTHRMLSRNSASSRAIPIAKMIKRVMEDPYIPSSWGKNQKGMQAGGELPDVKAANARSEWLLARDSAVEHAKRLLDAGLHKQITNRLLEPFMWHTIIVTATEWDNLWHLRDNSMAHPDIQIPVHMMRERYEVEDPRPLEYGQWHTPLFPVSADLLDPATGESRALPSMEDRVKISSARCARVSYLTHEGMRDIQADLELHDRLLEAGHMSPFEHVAKPVEPWTTVGGQAQSPAKTWYGNFRGWEQYRKMIPGEHDILGARA